MRRPFYESSERTLRKLQDLYKYVPVRMVVVRLQFMLCVQYSRMLTLKGCLLVDASNAFNSLNRRAALHNVSVLCPPLSPVVINTYRPQ